MASSCPATTSRRLRLRDATSAVHARLDAATEAAGDLSEANNYRRYLRATLQARGAVERALEAAQAEMVFPTWPERRIADLLRRDLADVDGGVEPSADETRPPQLSTPGDVLGALYVLEGSALGARLLIKRVAMIGMGPLFGARHMAAQIANPNAWRAFLQTLEAWPMSALEERRCLDAATETFRIFETHLAAARVEP